MSLPDTLWEALALDRSVVRQRARFFEAYATMDEPLSDASALLELMRHGPLAVGEQRVVNLRGEDAGAAALLQRLGQLDPLPPQPSWVRPAETADALRQAAIATLLLDTAAEGMSTLRDASDHYRTLGLAFGLFLMAVATGSRQIVLEAGERLDALLGLGSPAGGAGDEAPAQQVSLLLTALSDPIVSTRRPDLGSALAAAPQASGSVPVGTTAQPMATWWAAGRRLGALGVDGPPARARLASLIAELGSAHGSQLRHAQLDRYHWRAANARVDLVDLDLAGLVALSGRALRTAMLPRWSPEDFADLEPLAQVSIVVGIQLSEGEAAPRPGPPGPAS